LKYYKLNFTGFYDSEEDVFGKKVLTEDFTKPDLDIQIVLEDCIREIRTKTGVCVDATKIIDYQIANHDDAGNLVVCGQDKYLLIINKNALNKEENLKSIIYHELCHLYQLEILFKDKVIFWNNMIDHLSAAESMIELAEKHLNVNNGHTEYWQYLADKINTNIRPKFLIKAYLTPEERQSIFTEAIEENYFNLDFNGFYDTYEDIFGIKEK